MANIAIGDTVKLNSGSPNVTVKRIDRDHALVSFTANDGQPTEKKFPLVKLMKA
jgi:hypothetical protein